MNQTYILLAGKRSPGNAIISSGAAAFAWQVNKGYGLSGATTTFTGAELIKFSVLLQLWTREQVEVEWPVFAELLGEPKTKAGRLEREARAAASRTTAAALGLPTPSARAMAISHPLLSELGVENVVVEERTQLTPSPTGLWTVEIKMMQYRPPSRGLSRANGTIPNAPGTVPRQEDLLDQKVQEARNAFNRAKDAAE